MAQSPQLRFKMVEHFRLETIRTLLWGLSRMKVLIPFED